MVFTREDTCFDGVGCVGIQAMDEDAADAFLEEHSDTYVGYLTMDSAPGYVLFAKLGTQMFQVDGYQCHIFDAELPPAESEDEGEEEDGTEDMVTESGLFKTGTLPESSANMTGFRRPGRGQGLLDGADITLFRGVDAADILQGGLGDCWLLSAFAALAEYPQALMGLFQQKNLTDDGKYDIQLFNFLEGQWKVVTIDDRLPVIQGAWGAAKCAYVQPSADGELWTCLLEKAFATMFGMSYQQISGGVSTTAFAALCGVGGDKLAYISKEEQGWVLYQPVLDSWRPYGDRNFQSGMWQDGTPGNQPKSDKEFHGFLCEWDRNNFIMCANSPAGSDTEFSTQGIVQGHAYTLIDARQQVGQLSVDLVQVRNPWGKKEWTGDWSDNSPLWDEYPDVRDALKPEASEDGAFWISMEDFADNYGSVAVVFKDMGCNYNKLCNPNTREVAGVLGGGLPGAGNPNLGVELPRKEEKQDVKRRKKALLKARKSKDEACAGCRVI